MMKLERVSFSCTFFFWSHVQHNLMRTSVNIKLSIYLCIHIYILRMYIYSRYVCTLSIRVVDVVFLSDDRRLSCYPDEICF
jgi:hypothetical protein